MAVWFRVWRNAFVVLTAALAISALTVAPSAAGKRTRPQPTGAACRVTPDPVSNDVAGYYTVSGSGFAPYGALNVFVMSPSGAEVQNLMPVADATGNFAQMDWAPFLLEDGQWSVYVFQSGDKRMTLLASCSFDVL